METQDQKQSKRTDYRISLASIDKEFVEAFSKATAKVLGKKKIKIYARRRMGRRTLYEVTYSSKSLYEFLSKRLSDVLKVALVYPTHFLRGLFDADGYVARGYWRIGLSNSDKCLLQVVKSVLKELGIESRIEMDTNRKGCKRVWKLVISKRASIERFYRHVGFTIERKKEKLKEMLES